MGLLLFLVVALDLPLQASNAEAKPWKTTAQAALWSVEDGRVAACPRTIADYVKPATRAADLERVATKRP